MYFGCAGELGACLLFSQAAISDIDLPRSVDCLFLQIGGNDLNSATSPYNFVVSGFCC